MISERVVCVQFADGTTELAVLLREISTPSALIQDVLGDRYVAVDAKWRQATAAEVRVYWQQRRLAESLRGAAN